MVLFNILYRTFFIRSDQYGTAFTLDVGDNEYLITADHLLPPKVSEVELQIFHDKRWLSGKAQVIGRGQDEIDIAVLRVNARLTPPGLPVTPSIGDLALGQDMFFLGFPFKAWGDVGSFLAGLPLPFAKKGTLSSLSIGTPQTLHIDAINNQGFSGGPLFFYPHTNPNELRIAGVVSKFRIEYEKVLDEDGMPTKMSIPYNTGLMVAYGIKHVLEIIRGM
jgi:S1-C subfamily serine protease